MNLGELDLAAPIFQSVVTSTPTFESQTAEWYIAMIALMDGSKVKAIGLFEQTAREKGPYHKKAKQVLEKIKYSIF